MLVAAVLCAALLPAGAAAAVPANGRAWELVTPEEAVTAVVAFPTALDPSGTSLVYMSFGPMPGARSGAFASFSRAVRGGDGWTSSPLNFPYANSEEPDVFEMLLPFVPAGPIGDPYSFVLSNIPLSPESVPAGHDVLYRRLAGDEFRQIATLGEDGMPLLGFRSAGGFIEPASTGDALVFATTEHLSPSDATRTEGRSIYRSTSSSIEQVDVGGSGSSISECGSTASHHDGISSDGSRIFFISPPSSSSCAGPSEVYLREGGATTKISASQCTRPDCGPGGDAAFAGATPDGRFAFLDTAQQLTNDDADSLRDLYRYDASSDELTLLSGGQAAATGELRGAMAFPSADGAYVYFYALGSLVPDDDATAGGNFYVAGPDGLRFVAPAEPELEEPPAEESVQLARGGEVALFGSAQAGVADDVDARKDVYLYDAGEDALTRLSNGPTGGNGEFDARITSVLNQEPMPIRLLRNRALSEDGRTAFFVTAEALVPEDVNESIDIYEWRRSGVGLVSSGTGDADNEAAFYGSSPDGSTAVFQTRETLLPGDRDGGEDDIYVARVGGGFADAVTPVPGCEGPFCWPVATARLSRPVPASARPGEQGERIRLLRVLRRGRSGGKAGGQLELLVSVPAAGRVAVAGTELGGGKERIVEGVESAPRAGKVRIPLRLSGPLTRVLDKGDSVRVRLVIRQASWTLIRTVTLVGRHR